MGNIFFEITVIICFAAFLAVLFRVFKQPAILAYILTGIIFSHLGVFNNEAQNTLHSLAELGITLLLFMLGLEIKIKELPTIGKVASIVGISQILATGAIGYLICILIGYSQITSLYISSAIAFSSTIIVVKLLSDKKDLHSLYGKISVGILLIQDVFAIGLLIFLSSFNINHLNGNIFLTLMLLLYKGLILILVIGLVSKYLLPFVLDFVAKSSETLFLFSLAWVFGLAALVSSNYIGFSIEIGGFIAGLSLSSTTENYQIAARMKTLRDFFIVLFFVLLGAQMSIFSISKIIIPAIIISLFVLLIKPFLVMIVMGIMGYRKRTSFFTGVNVSQISEFSLILIFLGAKLGQVDNNVVSLITLVGIITFTTSSFMIYANNGLYHKLHKFMFFIERKYIKAESIGEIGELTNHTVLVGGNSMGESILSSLNHVKDNLVVVDFDPEVVKKLNKAKIKSLFGDIVDFDIQEKARLHKAKLVISTISDLDDNLLLIKSLNKINRRAKIIVIAQDQKEARHLYKKGADFVVIPYIAGGRHVAKLLRENKLEKLESLKEEEFLS